MQLGYNTNGFAHHASADALRILADVGYRSVAVTLERDLLGPPTRAGVARCVATLAPLLATTGLRATIETGSRFLLDPRRKHQPTLISQSREDRRRRVEFLMASVDVATGVGADCVSLWSGASDDAADENECFDRLTHELAELLVHARDQNIRLAFEPEPGMFIDTMARFERLSQAIEDRLFGLTLDVGHVHCLGDGDVAEHITRWADRLFNVHIEDMRRGVHEHLMFGEGDMDFAPIFAALREVGYTGPIHVELSRHSHSAVETARQSFDFLRSYLSAES